MPRVFYLIAGLTAALAVVCALVAAAFGIVPSYQQSAATTANATFYLILALGLMFAVPLWAAIGKVIELLQVISANTGAGRRAGDDTGGTAPNPGRRSIMDIVMDT